MKYESIADIYSANEKVRQRLHSTISEISEAELTALPEGEAWTIQQLVEHISIVEFNVARICGKLLEAAKAHGKLSDGSLALTDDFESKWGSIAAVKLAAPERVQPTGSVLVAQSFEKMDANRETFAALRSDFESYDLSGPKFPHPYFGDLTATEWFILAGGHEARHIAQIEKLLEKIRK